MARHVKPPTRREIATQIQAILTARGVREASCEDVLQVIDAWLAGCRGVRLPHGLLGIMVGAILEDLGSEGRESLSRLR